MNTDNTSNREASSCEVVSTYFSHNPVMDESSKKNKENSTQKPKSKTNQAQKRPRKRPQGQKDIRSLIKKKKNELVSYSKDFELICKQSGIDVDPEQLQLAIALSKSLQDSEVKNNDEPKAKNLTANQRKGKIRTTLQEYGFKVPESKPIGKKVKKYRKQYKLLLVSDNEKQQIIADKYAQILIRNVNICSINDNNLYKCDSDAILYNLSTNATYKCIKNDDIFYIPDLIPRTFNERHNLLRDWSTIPGRPPSPKIDLPNIDFNSIECSEEELCEILSGSIQTAQSIVKRNYEINSGEIKSKNENFDVSTSVEENKITNGNLPNKELFKDELAGNNCEESPTGGYSRDFVTFTSFTDTEKMTLPTNRSYSPDIFDDEVTIIMDTSKDIAEQEEITEKTTVREQNDFMDLTECVNIVNSSNINTKQNSCLSQGTNKTTINANDFMELTACVTASSQKILKDIQIIDNEKENNKSEILEDNSDMDHMDLTQSSNSNSTLPILEKDTSFNKSLEDDTIIMVEEDYCNINADQNKRTSASKETDIIDLVTGQHSKPKVLHDVVDHDAVIYLFESPENNYNEHKKSKSGGSKELECKTKSDAIDFTQAWKRDELPSVSKSRGRKISSDDIIPNHDLEEENMAQNLSGDNCPKGITCNYDNAPSPRTEFDPNLECNKILTDSPPFISNYECDYTFDDPITHVPISPDRYPEESDTENDKISLKNKNIENVDLTQSSDSEDSIKTADDNIDEKSAPKNGIIIDSSIQDDTILLNDEDYYTNNLANNDLEIRDDIDAVEGKNSSNERRSFNHFNENSNHSNSERAQQSIYDCDNDREFDNLLGNVSNRKQSTSQTSKCYDVDEDEELNYKNRVNSENEPEIQNREFDLTQHSDCSNEKNNSPKSFEISHDLRNQHDKDIYNQKDEIDLTQHSDSEDNNYRQSNNLGIRNDISIDYDEVYIDDNNRNDCDIIFEAATFADKEKGNSSKDDVPSNFSQNSEVFEISDNEFNYSITQHKLDNDSIQLNDTRFDIGGMSIINEFLNRKSVSLKKDKLSCSCSNIEYNESRNQSCLVQDTEYNDKIWTTNKNNEKSSIEFDTIKVSTPTKFKSCNNVLFAQTPKNNDYIIKTDQVTPMPKYEIMSSPERNEELDKYGIKPLKRKRAIQILTHIYNQTHPVMEIVSDSETYSSPSKIRKKNPTSFPRRAIVTQIDTEIAENCIELPDTSLEYLEPLSQESKSCKRMAKKSKPSPKKNLLPEYSKNANKENNLYEETKLHPDIRDIECPSEEWVFQKREKAKVYSCRVPLHIAFHNYVSCRTGLREAILRYEPINIDDIHKGLVAVGYRYNPKDLLKFMDKKCITVKTADNARNNKK